MGVDTMKEQAMELLRGLSKTTTFKRRAFFLVADTLLIAFSMYASFWIRFDGKIPYEFSRYLREYIILALVVKLCFPDVLRYVWHFLAPLQPQGESLFLSLKDVYLLIELV
jgi:predicted metal-dependent hydrolase